MKEHVYWNSILKLIVKVLIEKSFRYGKIMKKKEKQ